MIFHNTIIIGAGAAGLMCAIEAGKHGRKVLVIEYAEKIGKKILISGGGRCNFTNIYTKPENFISKNPHFCKSALARYTPQDFISLVEKHNIKYHEKKLGQLFCDNSAKEIINMLEKECNDAGVEILLNRTVNEIKKAGKFVLETNKGEFECKSVVIATGGISIPQMGATDFGYKIARQFGIKITKIVPALVPFMLKEKAFSEISGVSIDSIVSCNGTSFRENILFTHNGLSGPAILQISSYWDEGDAIRINLLPEQNIEKLIEENRSSKMMLDNFLSQFLPKRFVDIWSMMYFKPKSLNKLSANEIKKIAEMLHYWVLIPSGTEGFGKAEVTKGGVDTGELSSKTMECKKINGLYFIGEVVDVTGWLGGYNFQWAWASGFAAGEYA
jgi:predicted Rossmann fold flavoprotein